ncbi:isopenicillin N synthase [Pochonia chlamydosporia 170]|uniref:Isopenicillin N synthase n=1 Tax=Pochonia chlamydosporia 170 TaxID=1380566 RepID=A0A179FNP9_METCM|nr:isopenicillin N synthase [Pochonia chlamydosporia 170]OAQ67222.1 isopenicillin N synthase [Pochonia chlamydosporia 170]
MGSVSAANVPRIDISPLFGENKQKKLEVAREIDAASRDTGFFYAVNHGVDLKWLSEETKKFHMSLTHEEKWKLAIRAYNKEHEAKIRSGYSLSIPGKKAVESLCYLNPSFQPDHPRIKKPTPLHEVNDWPEEDKHPGFRNFAESYFWEAFRVSSALLRGYALALDKDEDFFTRHFRKGDTLSSVVLIRYPFLDPYPEPAIKTAEDGTKLSFEWHEDVSLITVLYQSDVQNLQVKTPQGWLDIEADDSGYLVNCGNYMSHITDNYYPAPIHRVKWVNEERQSLPFFVNLGFDDAVVPWDAAGTGKEPAGETISYGNYLQNGLLGLIKKNGQT